MTATQWLEMLLSYSLQVLVVILASSLLERAIYKPADRSAIWNTCFLSILFLTCTGLLLPRLHLIQPWKFAEPQTLILVAGTEVFVAKILLIIWCLGVFVSLTTWLIRGIQLRRTLKRCQALPLQRVQEILGSNLEFRHGAPLPNLLISDDAEGPYCLQLHRPIIVLPRILLDGTRDDLRNVLTHEIAHLQNNHPLQLFLQQLAQVVCWFHPAIWRASSRASLLREYTCDDAVLGKGVPCGAYLRTLLHIAERAEKNNQPSAIGFGKTPTELVLRAKRMVDFVKGGQNSRCNSLIGKRAAVLILLIVTCLMTQFIVPVDPMSSSRTVWSTWPTWTAQCLHCLGIPVRDYELFDRRVRSYEQLYDNGAYDTARLDTIANKP